MALSKVNLQESALLAREEVTDQVVGPALLVVLQDFEGGVLLQDVL